MLAVLYPNHVRCYNHVRCITTMLGMLELYWICQNYVRHVDNKDQTLVRRQAEAKQLNSTDKRWKIRTEHCRK